MDNDADMVTLYVSYKIEKTSSLDLVEIYVCQNQKLQISIFMV